MLEFSDAPYRFFEPRQRPALFPVARWFNRRIVLPGSNHRVAEMRLEGETDLVRDLVFGGCRIVFVANHPTHSDPQVVTEALRRLGAVPSFMAAYDVFLRSRFQAWVMQSLGNFSVDREGSDRRAMTTALDVVKLGRQSLTIFPEGNVYLTNDRVTPFLEGAAFIALKAQQALECDQVYLVPLSLKYTHLSEPRATVKSRLVQLAEDSGHRFGPEAEATPVESVFGLGLHLLERFFRRHGFEASVARSAADRDPDSKACRLGEVLESSLESLLNDLEAELNAPRENGGVSGAPLSRIRQIRGFLHQHRAYGPDASGGHPTLAGSDEAEIARMAEKAILALRIHGYLQPYLRERPSIDRYDETVERLSEDYYSRAMPRSGPRRAVVRVHAPVDAAEILAASGGRLRHAVAPLTRHLESVVQQGIEEINSANDAPGAQLIASG